MSASLAKCFRGNLKRSPFVERVAFFPAGGGPPRTITVDAQLAQQLDLGDLGQTERDTLTVVCLRDASDADLGGIGSAQIGDALLRAGEARKFSFSGVILDESPYHYRLEFTRPRQTVVGGTHTQR